MVKSDCTRVGRAACTCPLQPLEHSCRRSCYLSSVEMRRCTVGELSCHLLAADPNRRPGKRMRCYSGRWKVIDSALNNCCHSPCEFVCTVPLYKLQRDAVVPACTSSQPKRKVKGATPKFMCTVAKCLPGRRWDANQEAALQIHRSRPRFCLGVAVVEGATVAS